MLHVTDQADMERALINFCRYISEDFPGTISQGLSPRFVRCSFAEDSWTIAYDIRDWMRNPGGVTHGGAIAAMMDVAMGGITYACAGEKPTPTIAMELSYVRPIPIGVTVYVDVQLIRAGRTVSSVTARMYQPEQPERILITSTGSYYPG
jgi:uncharacterized protein (TIGR00369 family)